MQRWRKPPTLAFAYISPARSSKRRISNIFERTVSQVSLSGRPCLASPRRISSLAPSVVAIERRVPAAIGASLRNPRLGGSVRERASVRFRTFGAVTRGYVGGGLEVMPARLLALAFAAV